MKKKSLVTILLVVVIASLGFYGSSAIPIKAANLSETVTVPFVLGLTGVNTGMTFTGRVKIEVSGTGQALHQQWSDAFYVYTPGPNQPDVPCHFYGDWNMGLKINGKPPEAFEGFVLPNYNPSHQYTITITLDQSGPINFSVGDPLHGVGDNTGQFVVTVEQLRSPVSGGVGWETYPVNKMRVMLPWIALVAAIMAGVGLLVLRRLGRGSEHIRE